MPRRTAVDPPNADPCSGYAGVLRALRARARSHNSNGAAGSGDLGLDLLLEAKMAGARLPFKTNAYIGTFRYSPSSGGGATPNKRLADAVAAPLPEWAKRNAVVGTLSHAPPSAALDVPHFSAVGAATGGGRSSAHSSPMSTARSAGSLPRAAAPGSSLRGAAQPGVRSADIGGDLLESFVAASDLEELDLIGAAHGDENGVPVRTEASAEPIERIEVFETATVPTSEAAATARERRQIGAWARRLGAALGAQTSEQRASSRQSPKRPRTDRA